ncbi:hypothetical protein EHS39_32510 [Ensifer sp. MPMI2T]|nr:hypothetical protein EHS39_32510 [Ensifer sp. MPMI2T]
MARFQCAICSYDGHAAWAGELVCPRCGSTIGVRAAVGIEEMTEREADAFEAAADQLAKEADDEEGE